MRLAAARVRLGRRAAFRRGPRLVRLRRGAAFGRRARFVRLRRRAAFGRGPRLMRLWRRAFRRRWVIHRSLRAITRIRMRRVVGVAFWSARIVISSARIRRVRVVATCRRTACSTGQWPVSRCIRRVPAVVAGIVVHIRPRRRFMLRLIRRWSRVRLVRVLVLLRRRWMINPARPAAVRHMPVVCDGVAFARWSGPHTCCG